MVETFIYRIELVEEMTLSDEEIIRRYIANESQRSISRSDGRGMSSIRWVLDKYNVPIRDPRDEMVRYGKLSGEREVKSGRIARLGKTYGPTRGRTNVDSGHLARISILGGKVMGPRIGKQSVEDGTLLRARQMSRKSNDTRLERHVEQILKDTGFEYEHPFVLRGKLCDFYLPEINLVIEADGCYWHGCNDCNVRDSEENRKMKAEKTKQRNRFIEKRGYLLLTVPEHLFS